MKPLPSIRRRLSRALVVVSLAWGVAVSVVVWLGVRHEVDEILDATLQEAAEVLFGVLLVHADAPPVAGGSLPAPPHEERIVWQIVGPGPAVLLRSHRAPETPLLAPGARGLHTVADDWRVHAMPLPDGRRVLLVAQPGDERVEARLEAAQYTAGAALAVGLACALWLSLRVRRELEPLSALSHAVGAYDPLQPGARLADPQRAELAPMHGAIVALGTGLGRRVRNERAFTAHAAHALRTPLAGMVAQLATAQRVSPPEAQPMLALARQAADRLRRVVTALLTLFRAGAEIHRRPVDLTPLVRQLPIDALDVEVAPAPPLDADADLLAAALVNLLENSARHGARHVRIAALRRGRETHVELRDDGPGVDAQRADALSAALATQDYEGRTGLGLMLADLVARAHGGQLRLLPGPGFAVEIVLADAAN